MENLDHRLDRLSLFACFLVYTVVDNAVRAVFQAGMSAFHHLWGCASAYTFVEHPTGTSSLLDDLWLSEKYHHGVVMLFFY